MKSFIGHLMRTLALSLLLAIAPASFAQSPNYGYAQEGAQQITLATVLQVQPVQIQVQQTNTGANVGNNIGYAIGSNAGYGSGSYALGQITSELGRTIGQGVEARRFRRGMEIFVRDEHGRVLSIVQSGDVHVRAGEQVALVGQGSRLRVVPIGGR